MAEWKRVSGALTLDDDVLWRAVGCYQLPERAGLIQGAAAVERFHDRALAGATTDPVR